MRSRAAHDGKHARRLFKPLQNAASIASLLLTTEALVSEIAEKTGTEPREGGMGGMY